MALLCLFLNASFAQNAYEGSTDETFQAFNLNVALTQQLYADQKGIPSISFTWEKGIGNATTNPVLVAGTSLGYTNLKYYEEQVTEHTTWIGVDAYLRILELINISFDTELAISTSLDLYFGYATGYGHSVNSEGNFYTAGYYNGIQVGARYFRNNIGLLLEYGPSAPFGQNFSVGIVLKR